MRVVGESMIRRIRLMLAIPIVVAGFLLTLVGVLVGGRDTRLVIDVLTAKIDEVTR